MGDQIRAAALRWALLKRVAEHIRDRRESFDSCPRQSPCWKQRVYSLAHDDEVPLPRSEWCHDCLDRQTYHDALVLVVPMRAGAQRGLFKRCQTALAGEGRCPVGVTSWWTAAETGDAWRQED